MNNLEYAKEQMSLVDGKSNEEDMRRAYLANSYALIAIAEKLRSIDYKIGAEAEHTQRIAEQLEYNNKLLYAHAMNKNQCKVCGHLSDKEDK